MVGFYGGAPLEYQAINDQGIEAVPSSTGEVIGAAFGGSLAANLFPRLMRSEGRFAAETGMLGVDDFGRPVMGEPEPTIDPQTANSEFGIKGVLSFDKPVPRSVAQDLHDHKQAEIERQDTIARRESGLLTGGAARFTAGLAAGLLDPINVAAGFIPFIGEARVASLLGRGAVEAAGAAERAGVRALTGAGQGAVSMAALQPLEFGLSRGEQEDYTMADALRSVALGTVLGGGLHAGVGAALDRATGRYRNPITQAVEDAGPETREAALQGALAQTIEGRPVEVAPVLDGELPPVPADHVRFYHGGTDYADGSRWLTEYRAYAEGYAAKSGGRTFYVDVPESWLKEHQIGKVFEDEGTGQRAAYVHFDAPEEIARNLQPVPGAMATADSVLASARREPVDALTARADADTVMARPSDDLQAIHQQIAELERQTAPPEGRATQETEPASTSGGMAKPQPTEAELAVQAAESRAAAVERAAFCIQRGG